MFIIDRAGGSGKTEHRSGQNPELQDINTKDFYIEEAYSFGLTPQDRKHIRKIIFEHLDYIVAQREKFQARR